jgi:dephospho-CoA kinase
MLQHLGAYPIDADELAHQVMMPNAPAYKPIINTFGQFIVGPDGRINRTMLGQIVFSNPEALKKLEDITHPIIRQGINALVTRSEKRVVVIEAIKLLEGDLASMVDTVWVVDAKPQTQYKRLIGNKMSEADAKQRILAQGNQADKVKRANFVIQNDGNVEDTWKQVQTQWNEIRKLLTSSATPATPPKAATGTNPAVKPVAAKAATGTSPAVHPPAPKPADDFGDGEVTTVDIAGITVKRGTPSSAQQIADFIKETSGKAITRMDVMLSFGQKSYLVAYDQSGKVISVMGWTVENLVTRMDEFYLAKHLNVETIVNAMVIAIEEASKELQSEVAFFFFSADTLQATFKPFNNNGYAPITLKEIKIPAWREAVEETLANNPGYQVLWKQLRKDRVLQPI